VSSKCTLNLENGKKDEFYLTDLKPGQTYKSLCYKCKKENRPASWSCAGVKLK
jgi:hypothetical protein